VNKLEMESNVRVAGATRLETASGNPLPIPKVTAHAAASWAAELSTLAAADDTFAQTILNAYKAVKLIKVSLELLEDSGVNIEDYISSEIGRAIGRLEGDAFATGASGSTTTPEGVINKATIGVTTAAAGGLVYTSDEFIDMVYSLTRPYRDRRLVADVGRADEARRASSRTRQGSTSGSRRYTKGEQESLLGYPVYVEPTYANPGSAVLDGDVRQPRRLFHPRRGELPALPAERALHGHRRGRVPRLAPHGRRPDRHERRPLVQERDLIRCRRRPSPTHRRRRRFGC
jgi:HK97 family phage major capsid protein